jgi:uncharacterized protein (DUF983 family)
MGEKQNQPLRRTKPPFAHALHTARACVCPNCGQGPLFTGWLKPRLACPVCRLTYYPESGYYVGAMYLNYIASTLFVAVLYLAALPIHSLSRAAITTQILVWVSVGILVCLGLMRFAYSFWISVDFWLTPWEPGVEYPQG